MCTDRLIKFVCIYMFQNWTPTRFSKMFAIRIRIIISTRRHTNNHYHNPCCGLKWRTVSIYWTIPNSIILETMSRQLKFGWWSRLGRVQDKWKRSYGKSNCKRMHLKLCLVPMYLIKTQRVIATSCWTKGQRTRI